jgi:predicted RecA/RadA family phage recombinase
MKNSLQKGDTLSLLAPYALASGAGFLVGAIFAVASNAAANGELVEGARFGVYNLAKTPAQAWVTGQRIFWDNTNKRCDTDSTVGLLIGAASAPAANPSAAGSVVLNGTIPTIFEGAQTAIADIAIANATDAATAATLANASKATINTLLSELRILGLIL